MSKDYRWPQWKDCSIDEKLEVLRHQIEGLYAYFLRDDLHAIIDMLEAHIPFDDEEAKHLQTIKEYVYQYPLIVSRRFELAHLVGSGLVINLNTGRILLHYHPTLSRWLQFGGHARYETDFAQVAMREALEESGLTDLQFFPDADTPRLIDVDAHVIPERNRVPKHLHLDLRFLLSTRESEGIIASDDAEERRQVPGTNISREFRWFTCAEAISQPNLLGNVRRLIQKAQIEYDKYTASDNGPKTT